MAVHSYSYHAQGSIVKFLGNPIFNQMVVQVFFWSTKDDVSPIRMALSRQAPSSVLGVCGNDSESMIHKFRKAY